MKPNMRNMVTTRFHRDRIRPLLRGVFAIYLLASLCFVAAHQHHGALQGHECASCTIAHTPVTVIPTATDHAAPTAAQHLLPVPDDQWWDSEPRNASHTRGPPLV